MTDGWLSIIGGTDVSDDPDCWFLWASSGDNGAPGAGSLQNSTGNWVGETYDLAFCLTPGVPCPADVPGVSPGVVDVEDLLSILTNWGPCPDPCPPSCAADIVPDCVVDVQDLLSILVNWGPCPS